MIIFCFFYRSNQDTSLGELLKQYFRYFFSRCRKEYAPFERILFSATAKEIPQVLFDQLAEGGILLAPVEQTENYHIITRYYKKNGRITSETIEQCLFVPVLDGTQK